MIPLIKQLHDEATAEAKRYGYDSLRELLIAKEVIKKEESDIHDRQTKRNIFR